MAEEKFSPDHKTDDAIDESNPLAIIQVNLMNLRLALIIFVLCN